MNAVPGTVLDAGEAPENKRGKKKSSAVKDHKQIKVYFQVLSRKTGDFPGGPVVESLACNAGDVGSIPGQGTRVPHAAGQLSP